jgi:hypothetical protein
MAGVVDTTNTFTTDQVITSTLLNNIIDQTFFTSDALSGSTLALVAGKMKVATNGITSNEMGVGAVTTNAIAADAVATVKILDSNVTTAKIADSAVTTVKIADANVTTAKIADASITPAKLNGEQAGSDPVYGIRAFARIEANGTVTRNVGFATISRAGVGDYRLTLTNTPSSSPIITATCHAGSALNFSANVQINTSTSFTVRTGYEDTVALSDSPFSIMVIY